MTALYSGARKALQTAHEWEGMAMDYDRAWAEKCLEEAKKARERAALYLRMRKPYEGRHEQH